MEEQLRIVAVDSDRGTLDSLNEVLNLEGYHISSASDSPTALAMLEECKPYLVILGTVETDLDGLGILRFIRQRWDVPVIMLGRDFNKVSLAKALALGADDYVTVPFGRKEFIARVHAKMRRYWTGTFHKVYTKSRVFNKRSKKYAMKEN